MSITLIIVIATSIVSIMAFSNPNLKEKFIFNTAYLTEPKEWYRFFSCALIHADYFHLIFNMVSLYSFGTNLVEPAFKYYFGDAGPLLYIALYVISQFLAMVPTYLKNKNDYYRSLGASGAISAIIFAGIFISPLERMGIIFLPILLPGFIFGFIFLAITFYLDRKGHGTINHSAHFFGSLAGIMLLIIFGRLFSAHDFLQSFIGQIRGYLA